MDSFHLEPQQIKRSWVILKQKKKLENSVNHTKSHHNILTELLRGPGGTPLVGLEGVFLDRKPLKECGGPGWGVYICGANTAPPPPKKTFSSLILVCKVPNYVYKTKRIK